MEYFEGVTLDQYISENGILSEQDSKKIMSQVLSSVGYLHEIGIAHRDIKPENVLINDEKTIKIIDFNISKSFSYDQEDSENKFKSVFFTQISSPLYCAPELKEQLGYNEGIDIWGVGTIMFTMLFDTFTSNSFNRLKTVTERWEQITQVINDSSIISDKCKKFICNLLNCSSDRRPTAAEALENDWICDVSQ